MLVFPLLSIIRSVQLLYRCVQENRPVGSDEGSGTEHLVHFQQKEPGVSWVDP